MTAKLIEHADKRGSGRTTRAMQDAPKNAVYIWWCAELETPRRLAAVAGRSDLEIVSPWWLTDRQFSGRKLSGVIVDHAAQLSIEQLLEYPSALMRVFI